MLQIALLLAGASFVRKASPVLMLAGLVWGGLGLSIFIDGLQGERHFPLHVFGLIILFDSFISLSLASFAKGAQRGILYFKGGVFLFIAILVLSGRHTGNLVMAIIFGISYFITGLFVIISAVVVRFKLWKQTIASGIFQILFSVFLFLPFPTEHDGTVSQFVGMILITSGLRSVILSIRMFNIKKGVSVFDLLAPQDLLKIGSGNFKIKHNVKLHTEAESQKTLVVHIWTPEGSAENETLHRPVFNRYIAAVDANGVISTGHAALEVEGDIYISLYPAVDIDRSPSEFFNTLKAIEENNVAGEFQKDYISEAKAWCESDRKIIFKHFNYSSLTTFWDIYRQTETYNLTWRNCSSSVAYALEAALDGVLTNRCNWFRFVRLFFIPELWIAAQLRKRATTMAWTPGLVLDYARALHAIVDPEGVSLLSLFRKRLRQKSENENGK